MSDAAPIVSEALLRLVMATEDDRVVTLDAVVVESAGDRLPPPGHPIALHLELPESAWMAAALSQLLREWTAEDAVVTTRLVSARHHTVARLERDDSTVALELLPSLTT